MHRIWMIRIRGHMYTHFTIMQNKYEITIYNICTPISPFLFFTWICVCAHTRLADRMYLSSTSHCYLRFLFTRRRGCQVRQIVAQLTRISCPPISRPATASRSLFFFIRQFDAHDVCVCEGVRACVRDITR